MVRSFQVAGVGVRNEVEWVDVGTESEELVEFEPSREVGEKYTHCQIRDKMAFEMGVVWTSGFFSKVFAALDPEVDKSCMDELDP